MSELRKVKLEEIKDVFGYQPDIADNWYVPAKQTWKYLAWCIKQIMDGKCFRNNKDANETMNTFEQWIEERAITIGETKDEEN